MIKSLQELWLIGALTFTGLIGLFVLSAGPVPVADNGISTPVHAKTPSVGEFGRRDEASSIAVEIKEEPSPSTASTQRVHGLANQSRSAKVSKTRVELHGKEGLEEEPQLPDLHAFEKEFVEQIIDTQWVGLMEGQIWNTLGREVENGAHLLSVECRSSLCRVSMKYNDQSTLSRFIETYDPALTWDSNGYIEILEPGTAEPSAVLFISRDGPPISSWSTRP